MLMSFSQQGKHASPSLAKYTPDKIRKSRSELEKLKAKLKKHYDKTQKDPIQLAAGLTGSDHRMKMLDKLKAFDKKRTDAGKKPIFKDDKKKPKPLPWYAQGTLTSRAPKSEEKEMSAAGKKGMADFQKKQERMRQKRMAKQGVRRNQNTFGYGSYGPKQFKEEVDPHIKTMVANGDSDEKIKKMHPII